MAKYELTENTKTLYGHLLHQVKKVDTGDLGGWIENEENLSQDGNCWIYSPNAVIYGEAKVLGNTRIFGKAHISGKTLISGNSEVRGKIKDSEIINATIDRDCTIYKSKIENSHIWYDSHITNCHIKDSACIHLLHLIDAEIIDCWLTHDRTLDYLGAKRRERLYVTGRIADFTGIKTKGIVKTEAKAEPVDKKTEVIKDFIYKVNDSAKLKVQTSYDSTEEFFADDSDKSYSNNEAICIIAIDTKIPLIKIEKAKVDNKKIYKFIVDITNKQGDDFIVRSVIDSKEKFEQLLKSTIEALDRYPQFNQYANDLNLYCP